MATTNVQVLPGRHGELYDDAGNLLAEVDEFQIRLQFNNITWRPAGSYLEQVVPDSVSVTLTFREAVARDAVLLKRLFDGLRAGRPVFAHFQGVIRGWDGTEGRYILRECIPDGNVDLASVRQGELVRRDWSFRVNQVPDLQSLLGG